MWLPKYTSLRKWIRYPSPSMPATSAPICLPVDCEVDQVPKRRTFVHRRRLVVRGVGFSDRRFEQRVRCIGGALYHVRDFM